MKSDARATYLKDEYLLLQKAYEDYDSRIITIKGWSATIGMAAIGAGFYQSRFLWLFAAGAAVVFWILEGLWKSFQYMNGPRIELIEEAFRTEQFDDVAPLSDLFIMVGELQDQRSPGSTQHVPGSDRVSSCNHSCRRLRPLRR